jgi:uroporphyrinogen decarboxylase
MKKEASFWGSLRRVKAPAGRQPDFDRFLRAVTTSEPGPVPAGDSFADYEVMGALLGERVRNLMVEAVEGQKPNFSLGLITDMVKYFNQCIRFSCEAGWDYVPSLALTNFPGFGYQIADNTSGEVKDGKRGWINDNRGPVMSWEDFERYEWPTNTRSVNLSSRFMAKRVPDGMKVLPYYGGFFEWTTWLMGLVPFSYALTDGPDLVDAVTQKVSDYIYKSAVEIIEEPNVGGIFQSDDLGYSTSTFVSPAILREKFLPHIKRMIDLAHSAGKVYLFHSCGNMYSVMDDLIEMGIDAKHSFEDKILPVEEVYQRWGSRVCIMGGVDMNLLAKGTESEVRKRTREILEVCGPGGRYVLGSGNSVANYVPLGNYLAMLDEGRKWNRDRFGREH